MEPRELRSTYDRLAPWYDALERIPEILLGTGRLRDLLAEPAEGRVLEVAVGTGRNLSRYPRECRIVGVDLSTGMLRRARDKPASGRRLGLLAMDAQALAFPDDSFDTVVDSLALCTYPDPVKALREMARVCRPDGRMLLLEHGRSDRGWLGRWQDRHEGFLAERVGCHWNRRPGRLVEAAGLDVVDDRRTLLGVFRVMEVSPDG